MVYLVVVVPEKTFNCIQKLIELHLNTTFNILQYINCAINIKFLIKNL